MIRSFAFTTTGRLHSRDIDLFLMPTLLADTNLFLWVDSTPAQVSLAWLLAKGADWSPIPGTIRIPHLEEDLAAVDVTLTAEQMARLDNITQPLGDHHGPTQMAMFDR